MARENPLQEQLHKGGLVKKSKVAEVAREQHKARHGKGPALPSDIQRDAERARVEKAERDRALAAERKSKARIAHLASQADRKSGVWGKGESVRVALGGSRIIKTKKKALDTTDR